MILLLLNGIGFSNLPNFLGSFTLIFVLFPCFMMLFCTKSLKSFGKCFLFTFGKKNDTLLQCKKCLQSVKMVFLTSAISGTIGFFISIVNMLRSYTISNHPDPLRLVEVGLSDLSVALLPIFDALIICFLLLPLYFMLKRSLQVLPDAYNGLLAILKQHRHGHATA